MAASLTFLEAYQKDGDSLLDRVVTGDETDTMSNRSPKFPLTDTRVAAVRAPHFSTTPTHAPTMSVFIVSSDVFVVS